MAILLRGALVASIVALRLTDRSTHEWLGLALVALIPAHVAVQWRQLAAAARLRPSVYLMVSGALLVALGVAIVSGVMISQVALPAMGGVTSGNVAWSRIHKISQHLVIIFATLHLRLAIARLLRSLWHLVVAHCWPSTSR